MKRLIKKAFLSFGEALDEKKWDGTKSSLNEIKKTASDLVEECELSNDESDDGYHMDCPSISDMYIRALVTQSDELYVWMDLFKEHIDVVEDLGYSLGDCVHLMINYNDGTIDLEYPRSGKTIEEEKEDVQELLPEWVINTKAQISFPGLNASITSRLKKIAFGGFDIGSRDSAISYINGKVYETYTHAEAVQEYANETNNEFENEDGMRPNKWEMNDAGVNSHAFAHLLEGGNEEEDDEGNVYETERGIYIDVDTISGVSIEQVAQAIKNEYSDYDVFSYEPSGPEGKNYTKIA
ncbi:MAG: hypothetical protein K0R18_107 [Bacillales bacterium]|jgi:hypothetical protein|nr:hypothetical protein [Bacillales bacterium]